MNPYIKDLQLKFSPFMIDPSMSLLKILMSQSPIRTADFNRSIAFLSLLSMSIDEKAAETL